MNRHEQAGVTAIHCRNCPLMALPHFRRFSDKELSFMLSFKTGELVVEAGATVLVEGTHSAHMYTVLSGWMFRHKALENGRRQVLNYALPGDLVGLQGSLMGDMQHTVEALTPVRLCVFEKDRISELFKSYPSLAYDLTWIASREERILDEHLLSIGQRPALQRAAHLMVFLYGRAKAVRLLNSAHVIPVNQQHVADTLGLSLVHTNKTLRKLAERKLIEWTERGCRVLDIKALSEVAQWTYEPENNRPYL